MNAVTTDLSVGISHKITLPALVGGGVAATLDAILAFATVGPGMPRGIASGLLGKDSFQEGAGSWILGLLLHYFTLIVAAWLYGIASLRWTFMRRYFVLCGVYYGISIWLFMNLIVVPLSAIHKLIFPHDAVAMLLGMLSHVLVAGLPIAGSFWLFRRRGAPGH